MAIGKPINRRFELSSGVSPSIGVHRSPPALAGKRQTRRLMASRILSRRLPDKQRSGYNVANLRAMGADELVGLRDLIGQVMADKAGETDTEIAELQELKKSVTAMAGK